VKTGENTHGLTFQAGGTAVQRPCSKKRAGDMKQRKRRAYEGREVTRGQMVWGLASYDQELALLLMRSHWRF
jgi:hypothetical protein